MFAPVVKAEHEYEVVGRQLCYKQCGSVAVLVIASVKKGRFHRPSGPVKCRGSIHDMPSCSSLRNILSLTFPSRAVPQVYHKDTLGGKSTLQNFLSLNNIGLSAVPMIVHLPCQEAGWDVAFRCRRWCVGCFRVCGRVVILLLCRRRGCVAVRKGCAVGWCVLLRKGTGHDLFNHSNISGLRKYSASATQLFVSVPSGLLSSRVCA